MTGLAGVGAGLQALGLLQKGKALVDAALALVGAHPMAAALVMSLAANAWQWHEAGVAARGDERRLATWQSAFGAEEASFASVLGSFHKVQGAITAQNASVDAFALASAARQEAAREALAVADRKGKALLALSRQLSAQAELSARAELSPQAELSAQVDRSAQVEMSSQAQSAGQKAVAPASPAGCATPAGVLAVRSQL